MRAKTGGYIAVAIGIAVAFGVFSGFEEPEKSSSAFFVRLVDPDMYSDGMYFESVEIPAGAYQFRFVPNGDSPQRLTISATGESVLYREEFSLQSHQQGTEAARYYTWSYSGVAEVIVPEDQQVDFVINPHGNLLGAVTVELKLI